MQFGLENQEIENVSFAISQKTNPKELEKLTKMERKKNRSILSGAAKRNLEFKKKKIFNFSILAKSFLFFLFEGRRNFQSLENWPQIIATSPLKTLSLGWVCEMSNCTWMCKKPAWQTQKIRKNFKVFLFKLDVWMLEHGNPN